MLGKASKIGSGLFSKLKSGINDLTDHTLDYAAQKGWDQTLRSNVGINLPRSGPKHSQEYIINLSFIIFHTSNQLYKMPVRNVLRSNNIKIAKW